MTGFCTNTAVTTVIADFKDKVEQLGPEAQEKTEEERNDNNEDDDTDGAHCSTLCQHLSSDKWF